MTKITLDQLSDYLKSGVPLDDVLSMIEMLQNYKEEILYGIEEWYDFIPEVQADREFVGYHWGNDSRQQDLKAIVTWLLRLGYALRWPRLNDDGDTCIWELVRGEQIGRLHWECDRFFIEGLPKPEESPNDADRFPECLSCWE